MYSSSISSKTTQPAGEGVGKARFRLAPNCNIRGGSAVSVASLAWWSTAADACSETDAGLEESEDKGGEDGRGILGARIEAAAVW